MTPLPDKLPIVSQMLPPAPPPLTVPAPPLASADILPFRARSPVTVMRTAPPPAPPAREPTPRPPLPKLLGEGDKPFPAPPGAGVPPGDIPEPPAPPWPPPPPTFALACPAPGPLFCV